MYYYCDHCSKQSETPQFVAQRQMFFNLAFAGGIATMLASGFHVRGLDGVVSVAVVIAIGAISTYSAGSKTQFDTNAVRFAKLGATMLSWLTGLAILGNFQSEATICALVGGICYGVLLTRKSLFPESLNQSEFCVSPDHLDLWPNSKFESM